MLNRWFKYLKCTRSYQLTIAWIKCHIRKHTFVNVPEKGNNRIICAYCGEIKPREKECKFNDTRVIYGWKGE